MATSPRKQQTKAAVAAQNPLGDAPLGAGVDLGSNMQNEDPVSMEFGSAPQSPAAHVEPDVEFFDPSSISPLDFAAFREWQTAQTAAAEAAQVASAATETFIARSSEPPRTVARDEQKTQISDSGRAPKVDAKDRIWIVLDDNDEIPPGGQFIGINGVAYMLLPGIEAFVPRAICDVLDHAIKSVPVQDAVSRRIIGWKNRKRFPYSIVSGPSTERREI
jgi:hypothetical protein